MSVLPIVTGQDTKILRTETKKIPKVTKDILKLIKDMKETVKDADGLGIAGPQVGSDKAVCLALMNGRMTTLINPNISWKSEQTSILQEGCLSLPRIDVDVERAVDIIVEYTDENGDEQERRLHDLDARVVQHEVDHLHGTLIVDYR